MPLTQYVEEIKLGIFDDPHAGHPVMLTEKVTVCPSCFGLHSLRQHEGKIYCAECNWSIKSRATKHKQ